MKSGETSILIVGCAIDDISLVDRVIFTIKGAEIVTKSYPGQVTYSEGNFAIPLTQEDTIALSDDKSQYCNIEGQINFKDKSVVKTKTEGFTIKGSLATELVEGNTPSAEPLNIITLKIENSVVIAKVDVDDIDSLIDSAIESKNLVTEDVLDEAIKNVPSGNVETDGTSITTDEDGKLCVAEEYTDSIKAEFTEVFEEIKNKLGEGVVNVKTRGNIAHTTLCDDDALVTIDNPNNADVIVLGKNLIPCNLSSKNVSGVDITVNDDNSITLNGTSTGLSLEIYNDSANPKFMPKGKYTFNFSWSGSASASANFRMRNGSDDLFPQFVYTFNRFKQIELSEDSEYTRIHLYFANGTVFENYTLKVAMFYGDVFDEYEKYYEKSYASTEKILAKRDGLIFLSDHSVFDAEYKRDEYVYRESEKTYGKKVVFIGDSITNYWYTYGNELMKKSKMKLVENFAVPSATFCNTSSTVMNGNPTTTSNNTLPNQVQKLLNGNYDIPDIVIISGGTNDATPTNIDVESQFTTAEGSTVEYIDVDDCDLTTFSGSARWMFEKIKGLYPNALIVFATPIQRACQQTTNGITKNNKIRDLQIEIADRLATPYIDAFAKSGIYGGYESWGAEGKYLADGLHPNADGGIVLGNCYYRELLRSL